MLSLTTFSSLTFLFRNILMYSAVYLICGFNLEVLRKRNIIMYVNKEKGQSFLCMNIKMICFQKKTIDLQLVPLISDVVYMGQQETYRMSKLNMRSPRNEKNRYTNKYYTIIGNNMYYNWK